MKQRKWIRRERERKKNMVWMLVRIMEIASLLSDSHVRECTGSDTIQNYLLKAFPADQRHITKITLLY